MKLLDTWRERRRLALGKSTLEEKVDDLAEDVAALRSALLNHDSVTAREHERNFAKLGEVCGLLGLSPDEIPATADEIAGKDPHGL